MAQRLKKLEIDTIWELLNYYPFRYKNHTLKAPINTVQEGKTVTVEGIIKEIKNKYGKGGKTIQKAIIKDASGVISATWFNQPFLTKTLFPGQRVALAGKTKTFGKNLILVSPEYEIFKTQTAGKYGTIHTGRLVPVYSETVGIKSKYLRKLIAQALLQLKEQIVEILPPKTIARYRLLPRKEAIEKIHFPESKIAAKKAKERLAFEEMLLVQLRALERKRQWQKGKRSLVFGKNKLRVNTKPFLKKLPFGLTSSQKRIAKKIIADLQKPLPMNRLLQGDVGSGKTVIAVIAAYVLANNGFQTVLMAPTELLALQHYQTLKKLFRPFSIPVEIITRNHNHASKKITKITIGTHALLHRDSIFKNLGLVVIDEQHRFGVLQRGKLICQATTRQDFHPHLLTMTATPIPRTITLTLYGDLDLSVLDEMPSGRKPIATFVVPSKDRKKCYRWLKKEILRKKIQAFIVCPLIELSETMTTVKAAKEEFVFLQEQIFPKLKLALLHGKTKGKEKEVILKQIRTKKIDILVSTPVVEVGIDIPDATVMIIEGADRFGLAQLHQLRGRVGRREEKSRCFLFAQNPSKKALNRLKTLENIHQGTRLAEIDLRLRGPGEVYGLKQHGFPKLKLASFTDLKLITKTRKAATELVDQNPKLWERRMRLLLKPSQAILPN